MSSIESAFAERQRLRWLRPDAQRWLRPDSGRYRKPETFAPDGKSWREPAFDSALAALRREHAALRRALAEVKRAILARKAGFDPNQPRVPAGNSDGGQWTSGGGGSGGTGNDQSGEERSPLSFPYPMLLLEKPLARQELNTFLKEAAQWLVRAMRIGGPTASFLAALDALSWLDTDRPFIDAYLGEPRSLDELRRGVSEPRRGYNIHHIVEQTSADADGFSRELIDSSENLVRIPALKHWQITGWYMKNNREFGGLSPRDYLRGKDWNERVRVGHEALVRFEVLKK